MDGLIRKILTHCGCIPHYFPQNTYKNCSLQVHAECVTPMINAFKGSSNKCEKACDSRFYKQQTIMYGRLRHINLPSADISTGIIPDLSYNTIRIITNTTNIKLASN